MSTRAELFSKYNVLSRVNAFCASNSLPEITTCSDDRHMKFYISQKYPIFAEFSTNENQQKEQQLLQMQMPTIEQLDRLYYFTIYQTNFFSLIDFILQLDRIVSNTVIVKEILNWIDKIISSSNSNDDADKIEAHSKMIFENENRTKISPIELEYFDNWNKKKSHTLAAAEDPDLLSLRFMETLILLKLCHFYLKFYFFSLDEFESLKMYIMDLSEGIGLIKSLNENLAPTGLADKSMDIDFDTSNITTSSAETATRSDFEKYLFEKLNHIPRFKEIIEIIAERCGFPYEDDTEQDIVQKTMETTKMTKLKASFTTKDSKSTHWRRVKPMTIPTKHVTTSSVKRSSSLSLTDLKSSRFNSSARQVDLEPLPKIQPNSSFSSNTSMRRHSEASAPQIIQQTTPTKSKKYSTSAKTTSNDSFIILETPPRALPRHYTVAPFDLSVSAKRLFSPTSKTEDANEQ